jgi:hypothetical protein
MDPKGFMDHTLITTELGDYSSIDSSCMLYGSSIEVVLYVPKPTFRQTEGCVDTVGIGHNQNFVLMSLSAPSEVKRISHCPCHTVRSLMLRGPKAVVVMKEASPIGSGFCFSVQSKKCSSA